MPSSGLGQQGQGSRGPRLSEQLQALTEALAASSTQGRIFEVVLPAVSGALHASASAAFLRSEALGPLELSASSGQSSHGQSSHGQLAGAALEGRRALGLGGQGDAPVPLDAPDQRDLPMRAAAFPMSLDQQALGVLEIEFDPPRPLTVYEARFLRVVAAQTATALGRARGLQELEDRVQQRTRQLDEHRAALDAFVTFTEAAGTTTDELGLASRALETVQLLFPGCSTSYYLPEEGRWKAKLYVGDISPAVVDYITAGLPGDSPLLLPALSSGEVYFADSSQIERDQLRTREQYRALGVYPLLIEGKVQALLGLGLPLVPVWSELERALFRSLGRSLNLAVERARQAEALRTQRATLEAQGRVLEAFFAFSHDLTLLQEPYEIVRRAQELILAQLPRGYAVYYELEGERWRSRAQVGELPPELQAIVDAGRPYRDSWSNVRAWETGEPVYQDHYDPASDVVGELASFVQATATLPVRVAGQARGVLRVALTGRAGGWTPTERVLLGTLVQHLGTVMAGADQALLLERQRERAASQTKVLEAFALFSHDVTRLSSQDDAIRRAQEIVLSLLPGGYSLYFERGSDAWTLRSWSGDLPQAALAAARAGRRFGESEHLDRPWETGEAYYRDHYDPAADKLGGVAGQVTATASFPVVATGEAVGVMALARTGVAQTGAAQTGAAQTGGGGGWSDTDRTVIQTMIHNLGLVLDGVRSAELLRRQNAQLEAQARSLQGFNDLTRQLSVTADPHALVQRALDGMLSLLPDGYAVYMEVEGERWVQKVMAGSYGNAELEAAVAAGLPYADTMNLREPFESQQPLYQNSYDQSTDHLDVSMVGHLRATACLPVIVNERSYGVIGCALFSGRVWTTTDRAVLESIVRSLGLAIEGALGLEALQRQTVELQRSNSELERFAYIASHDLQEPLRTISSFSDLLQRRYAAQLDPKAQQYLDFISQGSAQMKSLVDDLLTFSRLSGTQVQRRAVALAEPLHEALTRLRVAIDETGAQVSAAEMPLVWGDAPQLAQLFQNLIGNALKFRRPDTPPRIELSAEREGDVWHLRVSDNGIGMNPEYFGRIFVMFQRLHSRSEYPGSGLGLSICQKIVEGHGGHIWVESQEGAGSTFHFTLPAEG